MARHPKAVPVHRLHTRDVPQGGQTMISTQGQVEERLTALEMAVSELQRQLATLRPAPDWLEQIIGSCKDEPAFEEAMALGRALRMAEPFPEDLGEGV